MRFVIAGGGTGGHVFPGIAVAQSVLQINPKHEIYFIGNKNSIEKKIVEKYGFIFKTIDISGMNSKSYIAIFKTLVKLPIAIFCSILILKRIKPNFVLGFGGYVAGPVLLAAWILRIPRSICEQNSIPGFTNFILGKYFVPSVWGSFENCKNYFSAKKYEVTGNPLRADFVNYVKNIKSRNKILILGGSCGARPLNQILPISAQLIIKKNPNLMFVHQTGFADFAMVKSKYSELHIPAEVVIFIDDIVSAYDDALLVIARSGAGICSELIATNTPSILIPFPQATNDHQTINAKELVNLGIAITLPQKLLTPESLSDAVLSLSLNFKALENMQNNAFNVCCKHRNASNVIAKKITKLCIR